MGDPNKLPGRRKPEVVYTSSDVEIIEVTEENSSPEIPVQDYRAYRRWLEQKYGPKPPPPNEPPKQSD